MRPVVRIAQLHRLPVLSRDRPTSMDLTKPLSTRVPIPSLRHMQRRRVGLGAVGAHDNVHIMIELDEEAEEPLH